RGEDPALLDEAPEHVTRVEARAHELEGDLLLVRAVGPAREKDRAHPAAADLADDLPRSDAAGRLGILPLVVPQCAEHLAHGLVDWAAAGFVEEGIHLGAQVAVAARAREEGLALRLGQVDDLIEDLLRAAEELGLHEAMRGARPWGRKILVLERGE